MYQILIFGDSNTWGYISGSMNWSVFAYERFSKEIRWPGKLQQLLGNDYSIIEEGLPGRTIATSDPDMPGVNGLESLTACLQSHSPIDLVIIMLGTNDLKYSYQLNVMQISYHLELMCRMVVDHNYSKQTVSPDVLVIAPPRINYTASDDPMLAPYSYLNDEINQLAISLKRIAKNNKYLFYDASKIELSDQSDGVHLDRQSHSQLAHDVAEIIQSVSKGERYASSLYG